MGVIRNAVRDFLAVFNAGEPKYAAPTGQYGGFGYRANTGQLDSYGAVSTLFSIVSKLSTSTAQVDWGLYRVRTDARRIYGPAEEDRTEVQKHQALKVWDRPNSLMNRMQFVERTQQHIDLAGEAFWLVEKVGTIPVALWPLRPDRMSEIITESGLRGWYYRAPDGTQILYDMDEIIHIQTPSPTNMYRGMSPVQALAVDLESVQAAGEYNRMYFRNSAAPSGVIQLENEMTDREYDRIQMQWHERHQGTRNAHRVGILDNNAKWVDTTTSMRDMQFVDLRNMSRELIREAYGIHPHTLGISETVNLANAYAADATFAKWQITPRLERIKLALNQQFLPMFGSTGVNVEFCYDNPVPPDAEVENSERNSRVTSVVALIREGAEPQSALEAMGLPDIEWTEKEPAPMPPQIAPTSPAPAPPPTDSDEADAQRETDAATVAALLKDVFA